MTAVPGSLFRRILFWAHLSSAVGAGVFILLMSITGVLLTYEHQIVENAARRNHVVTPEGSRRLSIDELALAAKAAGGDRPQLSLIIDADPTAPVTVSAGRENVALLNPLTGAVVVDAATGHRSFFRTVEDWHRWMGGDPRSLRAGLLDYANLLFLFITVSGLYLWLPAVWRWRTIRGLVLFQRRYINAKVRDFNWHHVFGVWMLVPLFVIALSGVVMSFPWANNAVYAVFGEQAPQRGGPPRGNAEPPSASEAPRANLQQFFETTAVLLPDWRRITLPLSSRGPQVDVAVELQSTDRRPPRRTVVLNSTDANLVEVKGASGAASAISAGQKARTWFRFAHTGEQYGIIGQTIAGLASLAACFLVYTGLALAWRRLILPWFKR